MTTSMAADAIAVQVPASDKRSSPAASRKGPGHRCSPAHSRRGGWPPFLAELQPKCEEPAQGEPNRYERIRVSPREELHEAEEGQKSTDEDDYCSGGFHEQNEIIDARAKPVVGDQRLHRYGHVWDLPTTGRWTRAAAC
jgi:hypothetical protein